MFTSAPVVPSFIDPVVAPKPQPPSTASSTQVLISTQEVLFSTAAAAGLRRQSVGGRLVAMMRHMFANPADASSPRPQYEPKHYAFIENALMAREMGRL
jgi:hypothetical protein